MVNLMEETESEGQNKVQHLKLRNRQLLDLFTHLADGKEDRQKCIDRLVTYLLGKEEESIDDDTKYSVRRLIQGLSSDRLLARLSYSVALCQLLRVNKSVNNEILFQFIEESEKDHGTQGNNKKSIRNARIGKVFAYLVLVQSQKLFSGENEQITKVIRDLVKMSAEKDYLAHLCAVTISQIIAKVKRKVFLKYVWPDLEDKLTGGWAGCSPDDLLIVINIKKHQLKACSDFLTEKWGDSHVITEGTFHNLSEIFKRTSKLYPVIHSVIDTTITDVTDRELDMAQFWKTAISPVFEKTRSSTHSIGIHIFDKLIPHIKKLSPTQVEDILYPSITTELARHNKDAVAKVMTLLKDTSEGKIQLTVLKCYIRQIEEPQYDIINELINKFVPETFWLLKKELMKCYSMKTSWISDKVNTLGWYRWCIVVLDSMVTKLDELPWQLDILQFLFIHSFFVVQKSSDLPHCKALAEEHEDSSRAFASQHFFKALTRLLSYCQKNVSRSSQFNKHLDVLYQLAQYADSLLQNPDNVQLQTVNFDDEGTRKQWTKMIELLPALQKKRSTSEKLGLHHAFELMFIYGGLQLFSDLSAVEVLEELHVCYKKTSQRRKSKINEEEPEWIEVVTELLLSFMLKGSYLSRNIAKTAMETLADHVTPGSIQLILDALRQNSTDEEEGMVGSDNEDDWEEMDADSESTADNNGNIDNDENMENSDDSSDDDSDDDDDDEDGRCLKEKGAVIMNGKGINVDEDDDDEDSGVEEEAGIEVADDLKKKVKKALGQAAVDSDESSEDEELSDTEMFQLDKELAAAFKSGSKAGFKKTEEEKKEQLVLFKARSYDLLEVIVKKNPSAHLIKEMVLPILQRVLAGPNEEKEIVLYNKARSILDQICKTKKMIVDVRLNKDELLDTFKELMTLSTKKIPSDIFTDIIKVCAFVVRMILTLDGHTAPSPVKTRSKRKKETKATKGGEDYQEKVFSLVQTGLKEAFKQKSGHMTVSFYGHLLEKHNQLFWPMWEGLLEISCATDLKTISKADAFIILRRLLHKDLVRELEHDDWSLFVNEVRKMAANVIQTVTSKEKHFTKELLNLFIKVYQVSTDNNFKLLEDREMKKLEDMMPEFNLEIVKLYRKVYRFMYKKELPNLKQKRKNETPTGEDSSPNKKVKLENQSVVNGNLGNGDESISNENSDTLKINGNKQKKRKWKQKPSNDFSDLDTSLSSPSKKSGSLTSSLAQEIESPKTILKQEVESSKTIVNQELKNAKTSLIQDSGSPKTNRKQEVEKCATTPLVEATGSCEKETPTSQKKKNKKKKQK